jgi:uncharacterized protein
MLWTVLGSCTLAALAPAASMAQEGPMPDPGVTPFLTRHTIVVIGHGAVDAPPDQATITLGVQIIRPTAREAQNQSSAAMNQIVRQITAVGVPPEKIHTAVVGLFPQRKSDGDSEKITGYEATNRVTVTVDDLRLAGPVIDASVAAGANTLEGLTFGVRDISAYRTQAFKAAVQDAQAIASALASAAGISPIHLARIDELEAVVVPRQMGVAAAAISTPVMPGPVPITVQIRCVYEF